MSQLPIVSKTPSKKNAPQARNFFGIVFLFLPGIYLLLTKFDYVAGFISVNFLNAHNFSCFKDRQKALKVLENRDFEDSFVYSNNNLPN